MYDRSFRLLLLIPLLLVALTLPAMADDPPPDRTGIDWDAVEAQMNWEDNYVWVKIILGQLDDKGIFHEHESVATPDCREQKRLEAQGEQVAVGVYVEGLTSTPTRTKVRTVDEREGMRRSRCYDTFAITINGEVVQMPATPTFAKLIRFGIPRTETEVRIQMPAELKIREHGVVSTRGDVAPLEMPAVTATPDITVPMERFPTDADQVVEIKVIYTLKKATRADAEAEARARSDAAYREYTAAAADAAGDTRTPPGNSP